MLSDAKSKAYDKFENLTHLRFHCYVFSMCHFTFDKPKIAF